MITRRNFLFRTGAVLIGAGIGLGTGLVRHRLTAEEPKPAYVTPEAADKYYRVTCLEIPSGLQAIYLGDAQRELWEAHLREVSWSTEDVNLVPDVGDTLQIERTGGVDPTKKIGTLAGIGLKVERFRVRVISVTEIK